MPRFEIFAVLAALAVPMQGLADVPACAKALPPDARLVFDASAPDVKPGAVLRDVVSWHTRALVMTGRLMRAAARPAAIAAADCLERLPH